MDDTKSIPASSEGVFLELPLLKKHKRNLSRDISDGQVIGKRRRHNVAKETEDVLINNVKAVIPPWDMKWDPPFTEKFDEKKTHIIFNMKVLLDQLLENVEKEPLKFYHFLGDFIAASEAYTNTSIHQSQEVAAFFLSVYCDHFNSASLLMSKISLGRIPLFGRDIPPMHIAAFYGSLDVMKAIKTYLLNTLSFSVDQLDSDSWRPLHYAVAEGHVEAINLLLEWGASPNSEGRHKVTPLHIAAYRDDIGIAETLLSHGANSSKVVSINQPYLRNGIYHGLQEQGDVLPDVVIHNSKSYSTLIHWGVTKGSLSLVEKMLERGSLATMMNLEGQTPIGLALNTGQTNIVRLFMDQGNVLADEDKNWRRIYDEESGMEVVRILELTGLDSLDCSNREGFSLIHLAATRGYLSLTNKLLSKQVNPNLATIRGETPLFAAIEHNHMAIMQQLIKDGADIYHVSKKSATCLHTAAKYNNFAAVDIILGKIALGNRKFDINLPDDFGFTPIYYAIITNRYDIVQRMVQYCILKCIHVKATEMETLLQFCTERNTMGQYDNAVVRVLEMEKELHTSKISAEKCLRMQLGTTEASSKARDQLQAMYEAPDVQRHCMNFWVVITCLFLPTILYYLDVYTDVILAVEYYQDFIKLYNGAAQSNETTRSNETTTISPKNVNIYPFEFFKDLSQSKINFLLTVFFIFFPIFLLFIWTFHTHVTQNDVLPFLRRRSKLQRVCFYFIFLMPPIGPIFCYMENTYAQVKYLNVNAKNTSKNEKIYSSSHLSLTDEERAASKKKCLGERLRAHYTLKHVSQMRVAINNVLEATLESAFQLILQLYIVGTQYQALKKLQVGQLTLGNILSLTPATDSESRLSKQVLSVFFSMLSLTWSFTSYHRFSKLGGLSIIWSLPLLFAIFFQIASRAIACTVFTLAYTWRIFIVLGIHYVLLFFMKIVFEEKSYVLRTTKHRNISAMNVVSHIRPYFYVILGAFTSTFVYFKIRRPRDHTYMLPERHSTFFIQSLFLILALLENAILLGVGLEKLDESYDRVFKVTSTVLCILGFIIGVILQWVYYGCAGHPWTNINGPTFERTVDGEPSVLIYRPGGQYRWIFTSCRSCQRIEEEQKDNIYTPKIFVSESRHLNGNTKV